MVCAELSPQDFRSCEPLILDSIRRIPCLRAGLVKVKGLEDVASVCGIGSACARLPWSGAPRT